MLRDSENIIKQRSKAAEARWPLDKLIRNLEPNCSTKVSLFYNPENVFFFLSSIYQVLFA